MKKVLIGLLAVLFTVAVLPQSGAASVGIKAGFNFANVKISGATDAPDFNNLTAPTAGFFYTFNLGLFAVQPEVLYSQRGMKFQEEIEGTLADIKYMLHYIEVPVFLKVNVLPAGPIRPVIFAGPSVGFMVSGKGKMTMPGVSETQDIYDYLKHVEFAGVFGAGLEFKLPAVMLSVDARYHLGFSNIMESEEDSGTVKNKGFSVMVGIGF